MRTIISTERPALQAAPDAADAVVIRELPGMSVSAVDFVRGGPADLLVFGLVDDVLGTLGIVSEHLPQATQDDACGIALALLESGRAPSYVILRADGTYEGTITRDASDGLVERVEIEGTFDLGLIGGPR